MPDGKSDAYVIEYFSNAPKLNRLLNFVSTTVQPAQSSVLYAEDRGSWYLWQDKRLVPTTYPEGHPLHGRELDVQSMDLAEFLRRADGQDLRYFVQPNHKDTGTELDSHELIRLLLKEMEYFAGTYEALLNDFVHIKKRRAPRKIRKKQRPKLP